MPASRRAASMGRAVTNGGQSVLVAWGSAPGGTAGISTQTGSLLLCIVSKFGNGVAATTDLITMPAGSPWVEVPGPATAMQPGCSGLDAYDNSLAARTKVFQITNASAARSGQEVVSFGSAGASVVTLIEIVGAPASATASVLYDTAKGHENSSGATGTTIADSGSVNTTATHEYVLAALTKKNSVEGFGAPTGGFTQVISNASTFSVAAQNVVQLVAEINDYDGTAVTPPPNSLYLYVDAAGVLRRKNGVQYLEPAAGLDNFDAGNTASDQMGAHQTGRYATRDGIIDRLYEAGIGFVRGPVYWGANLENGAPKPTQVNANYTQLPGSNIWHDWNGLGLTQTLAAIDARNASRPAGAEPIRVLFDLHNSGPIVGGAVPGWLISGSAADSAAVLTFFSNGTKNASNYLLGGVGDVGRVTLPAGYNSYGIPSYNGGCWGPMHLWVEVLKWVATLSLQYQCLIGIDIMNEPQPQIDPEITNYRNMCRIACDQIWRINPELIVSVEQSLNAREPPGGGVIIFANDAQMLSDMRPSLIGTPPLGSATQGGILFQFHWYCNGVPNNAAGGFHAMTRTQANDQARYLKRNYDIAKNAGQAFLVGEWNFFYETSMSLTTGDAGVGPKGPHAYQIQHSANPSADTLLYSDWNGSTPPSGILDWFTATGTLQANWLFTSNPWGLLWPGDLTQIGDAVIGTKAAAANLLRDSTNSTFDAMRALKASVGR